jgi:proteasome lid subunit RPN8/RPN11
VEIRIKQISPKTEKSRLPGRLPRRYPPGLPAVFIAKPILQDLLDFAASDLHYELGGVLVGRVAKSRRRLFLEIKNFVPATKGISRRASFEFTNEAQQEIHQVIQERFRDLRIVGWFHTHPGYGIFLSSADQFIDQNYFKEPFHIAVVIDPTKTESNLGVFVWDSSNGRIRVPVLKAGIRDE